ncbi:glycosyltransferase family 39 protein [Agromyces aurantiacus]|uniref:Glycosyltransferase family 39 protein n=1 Tax=Agromyces aurantiacus TaxID=165814 RepID=A0ABV9R0I4_9MICO|nr:glycosyltransferase family 39 protein [Agromyces aurantiacus]MBM7505898.1 4-amino-4-deoxy-L-arabinose transferase-like glycosyltransferase [Agromyces aurantiacus]
MTPAAAAPTPPSERAARAPASSATARPLAPLARGPVLALAAVLAATSNAYGYHRDELYFRMLEPAWGYVDQPPLTPLIARTMASIVDEPWFLHVPAVLAAVAAVFVAALIAREAGGERRAQSLAAWAAAASAFPMVFGHVLLTSSLDLVVWPLVCLFAMRALLRSDGRWWLAVGLVAGLATYNKLLVAVLLVGLAAGLLAFGPWRALRSPWLWAGVGLAVVLALPNVAYQVAHDWPQSAMGAALAENDGGETRWLMWPMLLLVAGPLLVPVWVAGLVGLLRRPAWRDIRLLIGAFVVVLVFTFVGSAQFHYPLGMVQVLLALGCVPTAEWMRTRARRALVWSAVALNGAIAAVLALPLVPAEVVGATPVPAINQVARDTVGWPAYVRQVAKVAADLPDAPIITANYGEAGALARFGPELGVSADRVFSGQNELWFQARPSDGSGAAVFVGYSPQFVGSLFESCEVVDRLDNGVGVDNEEQGAPVSVCTGMVVPWSEAWERFAHLD